MRTSNLSLIVLMLVPMGLQPDGVFELTTCGFLKQI